MDEQEKNGDYLEPELKGTDYEEQNTEDVNTEEVNTEDVNTGGYQTYSNGYNDYYAYNDHSNRYNANPYQVSWNRKDEAPTAFAVAALVFGILSIVCCCGGFISAIFGVLAIVFAAIFLSKQPSQKGVAVAGLVCGIVGLVLSVLMIVFIVIGKVSSVDDSENYYWDSEIDLDDFDWKDLENLEDLEEL